MEGLVSSIDDEDTDFTLKAYWKGYNIATCLANIQKALQEMKEQTLITSWKKLWPKKITHNYEGFTPDEVQHSAVDSAVRLARMVNTEGFVDMTTEEVNTLIDCHSEPLTDEDLVEMTKSASEEEEEVATDEEEEERGLTLDNLQELFNMARNLQHRAQEIDHNMVRAVEFSNRIDGVMALYKGVFTQMKKQRSQLPITMFLVHRKPPTATSTSSRRASTTHAAASPALSVAALDDPAPPGSDDEASSEEQ